MIRFYLDAHLSPAISRIAQGLGLDVLTSSELGHNALTDEEQLSFAAEENRCFVTKDCDDFIELTVRFAYEKRPHSGVLVVPRSIPADRYTQIARALKAYADRRGDAPMDYLLDFLQ